MENFMNIPETAWTEDDVRFDAANGIDAKSLAKRYCLPVKEIKRILKDKKE